METVEELLKIIRKNTDTDFVKVSGTPKRCVLKNVYDLVDVPGYFVEFWYPDYNYGDSIFISDIENTMYFCNAPSLFDTDCFASRCRWANKNEIEFREPCWFYI